MTLNRFNWFLYVALVALIAEVVFLVIQNRRLQAQVVAMANYRQPETLKVGEKVAPVSLQALDGTLETMSYGESMPKRLIYIFNTKCPACQKTLPLWKQLATEMPASVQTIAITADSLEAVVKYQQHNALNYPLFIAADTTLKKQYKVSFIPQTVLLDTNGTVQGLWRGVLQDSQLVQIRALTQRF